MSVEFKVIRLAEWVLEDINSWLFTEIDRCIFCTADESLKQNIQYLIMCVYCYASTHITFPV